MKQIEIVVLCSVGLLLTFGVVFYTLPKLSSETSEGTTPSQLMDFQDTVLAQIDATNLLTHVAELLHIKQSVLRQLRDLEKKCALANVELNEYMKRIEDTKEELSKLNTTNQHLRSSAKYLELAQQELLLRRMPKVLPPLPLLTDHSQRTVHLPPSIHEKNHCATDTCVDYSRCPLTSEFRIFVDPDHTISADDFHRVQSSANWKGDGRNHLLLLSEHVQMSGSMDTGRAMVVAAEISNFRHAFDVILYRNYSAVAGYTSLNLLPPQLPARRPLFLFGDCLFSGQEGQLTKMDLQIVKALRNIERIDSVNDMSLSVLSAPNECPCYNRVWCHCDINETVIGKMRNSTFLLVISNDDQDAGAVQKIILGLQNGAVPVVLGTPVLPFSEHIDWRRAVVGLPKARVPELHSLLRSIRDEDILLYRGHGRRIWENYFASSHTLASTIVDSVRVRLNIPARAAIDIYAPNIFNDTYQPTWQTVPRTDVEESVGPVEPPQASDSFQRNFTSTTLDQYAAWNEHFDANVLYPFLPYTADLPGDAKFRGSEFGYRPVGAGAGGSGVEFNEALGGNRPREQFTVVILTYQRETILSATLSRLNNLAYLNKVIVVWNSPLDPSETMVLPKIHVPIHVYKAEVNSLNNRFLPFDVIETEAVLSMDDDIQLRHDEINFAFRVWRENRERIVGFPARYHAWDSQYAGWLYNSNYTCEFSMVLTGASFFHKYYMYLYTHVMAAPIRAKVDEFMNCEDIAMNFLIAHQTRKPPIKVTSRWTFRCQDCPISLWEDESHFTERHICMQYFEQIYGYMPLLNSQFRADSVLFKTRIPPDKQKCYKII